MSLYDKYHSQHNKVYMYNLISNLIKEELSYDCKSNETYNQFFETNFINTFQSVISEDLKEFNQHLLDTQVKYVRDFLSKDKSLAPVTSITPTILHSVKRKIHLTKSSRVSYRIENPNPTEALVEVDKVILPIEDNDLFSSYVINLSLENTTIELYLRGTIEMRHRSYGIYSPFQEIIFQLNQPTLNVQFTNGLSVPSVQGDVFKIDSLQPNKLLIESTADEFQVGDYIRICNLDQIDISDPTSLHKHYKIKHRQQNDGFCELKINQTKVSFKGCYVMNVSLQHTISCIPHQS